nr:hypothetical protein [Tanacetum cinerariifolium]
MFEVTNDHVVNELDTHVNVEPGFDVGRTEEHVVEQVRVDEVVHNSGEEAVEQGNGEEFFKHGSGQQVQYDVDGIDSVYEN